MYLSNIEIEGFKLFNKKHEVIFNSGLNVLIGENGAGKSAVIDAIRLILNEDEFSRRGLYTEDFYMSCDNAEYKDKINIKAKFRDLSEDKKSEYITWLDKEFNAILNIEIEKKLDKRNKFKRIIWGGYSSTSSFEWEPLNDIQCVYLPPLRDAEKKLRATRGSRLARLLINLSNKDLENSRKAGKLLEIEKSVNSFNENLLNDENIKKANELINRSLKEALGSVYSQSTNIQINQQTFEKIVETLNLVFFPKSNVQGNEVYRSLLENSLGYNNLIYIATILAEFEGLKEEYSSPRILLIEEIEAHLHPQIQVKLIKYLKEQAELNNIQVILTTHSSVIASSVPVSNLISFNSIKDGEIDIVPLKMCGLSDKEEKFINRWLDVTKSNMLFSKGNIFVEGLAESILIPRLAEVYLNKHRKTFSLEEAGVSIISMNGIFFDYFMKLYNGYKINYPKRDGETKQDYEKIIEEFKEKAQFKEDEIEKTRKINNRCVALTDNDPAKDAKPSRIGEIEGNNSKLYLIEQLKNMTDNCRVFTNMKTFEYDLAYNTHNAKIMIEIILGIMPTDGPIKKKLSDYQEKIDNDQINDDELKDMAYDILKCIDSGWLGKGLFAQMLYEKIDDDFYIPKYICDSIDFILGD